MRLAFETGLTVRIVRSAVAPIFVSMLACSPADASHLVTGNGFGFAVVTPENGTITKLYTHPYSFVRPDPGNPLSEGIETANFIKELGWGGGSTANSSADYENDSHVIHLRRSGGEGFCFMPFGFEHPALIISWESASNETQRIGWTVEWSHSVSSEKVIPLLGIEMHLLKFEGVEESLLLIPLGKATNQACVAATALGQQPGMGLNCARKRE